VKRAGEKRERVGKSELKKVLAFSLRQKEKKNHPHPASQANLLLPRGVEEEPLGE